MRVIPVLLCAALLAACNDPEPPPPVKPVEGREETRNIRNTEAIGYAGDAIADRVDHALDANDARNAQLEAAADDTGP